MNKPVVVNRLLLYRQVVNSGTENCTYNKEGLIETKTHICFYFFLQLTNLHLLIVFNKVKTKQYILMLKKSKEFTSKCSIIRQIFASNPRLFMNIRNYRINRKK